MMNLISVIIPVYNAEFSVKKSLQSLLEQTYSNIEIIMVNDCSEDNSRTVLEQFLALFMEKGYKGVLIHHEENRGVAAARNSGLEAASGEYVYYVDADDFIAEDTIEKMVSIAKINNSDIVCCDWFLKLHTTPRQMVQPSISTGYEAITLMSKGRMKWNLWLFLVKRSLYESNRIRFIEGQNMGEDMMVMYKLFYFSKRVSKINEPLYYYDKSNENSLTNTYSDKHKIEVEGNLKEIDYFFSMHERPNNWEEMFNFLKLNIKLPLLISDKVSQYQEWKNWLAEANSFVLKNNAVSKRIKLVQFMALREQYWFLKFHYYLVIKIIYGIVYK